ncbi:MAG TPA: radical SAM protein, partial [Hellea balneolensis]|nr:radical SAM protein [Hellea balneolensis]
MANNVKMITQGCRLNAYESEVMHAHARTAGLEDAVIINTCAVTNEAVRQGRSTIRKAVREHKGQKIIVTGCAAQLAPKEYAAMDGVSHVLGNTEKMQAESFQLGRKIQTSDIMARTSPVAMKTAGHVRRSRAIVQIQNGCDHRCTFCIIPFGRGNSRSQSADDIVERVRALVGQGFNEVVLTGVDISSWGDDLPATPKLGNLVARL